jgi:hypothetical protein
MCKDVSSRSVPFAVLRPRGERPRHRAPEQRDELAPIYPNAKDHKPWPWFRQLRRRRPKGSQRSLRAIAAELAQRGILNERGRSYSAAVINSMLVPR